MDGRVFGTIGAMVGECLARMEQPMLLEDLSIGYLCDAEEARMFLRDMASAGIRVECKTMRSASRMESFRFFYQGEFPIEQMPESEHRAPAAFDDSWISIKPVPRERE